MVKYSNDSNSISSSSSSSFYHPCQSRNCKLNKREIAVNARNPSLEFLYIHSTVLLHPAPLGRRRPPPRPRMSTRWLSCIIISLHSLAQFGGAVTWQGKEMILCFNLTCPPPKTNDQQHHSFAVWRKRNPSIHPSRRRRRRRRPLQENGSITPLDECRQEGKN